MNIGAVSVDTLSPLKLQSYMCSIMSISKYFLY